jgi:hypothetical protein
MTKRSKLVERIKNNPKDVHFDEVQRILLDAGFGERRPKSGSSHYVYYHESLNRIVTLTKGTKRLPEYQVKDALRALGRLEIEHEKE